jgi:hypothetical protein
MEFKFGGNLIKFLSLNRIEISLNSIQNLIWINPMERPARPWPSEPAHGEAFG